MRGLACYARRMDTLGAQRAPAFGHDLVFLLSHMGGTANLDALRNAAAGAFGADALYRNCHGDCFSFYEALAFLASSGELERRGDEVSLVILPPPAADNTGP